MIGRAARIGIEALLGVLGVVVLLLGIALWRLSAGPVQLDFLTPRIEAALSDPAGEHSVDVGATELVWAGWSRTVDLNSRDVRIRDRSGATVAVLPVVAIGLSLRALVQGTFAPTTVELQGARLGLVRGPDGRFEFGSDGETEALAEPDLSRILPRVIEQLLSEPNVARPLSFLETVRITNGRIRVDDRKLGQVWRAPSAEVTLHRDEVGLRGDAALTVALAPTRARISTSFVYDKAADEIELAGRFSDLHPEAIVSVMPHLRALSGLSTPLDGTLSGRLGAGGVVRALRFDVSGGAGALALPEWLPETLPIRTLALAGRIDGARDRIEVESGGIEFGTDAAPGPRIIVAGALSGSEGGGLDVRADLTLQGVAMGELGRYWPEGLFVGERRWILRNITAGIAEEVALEAVLRVAPPGAGGVEAQSVKGTLRYRDLEIHYLRPLPPIVGVSGTGRFDQSGMTFSPQGGAVGALRTGEGTVAIHDLDKPLPRMEVDVAVAGPLREALELLDHERLALIRRLGITPASTEGEAEVRARFAFPLLDALGLDDIEIAAQARLEQVAVRDFLLGRDATEGSLDLSVDKQGMHLVGPVRLGGVALELDWNEFFAETAPYRTQLEAQVPEIDDAGREALGLSFAPYLQGPVGATLRYASTASGAGTLAASLDLARARLALDQLAWAKPAGEPGRAELTLELVDQRLDALSRIALDAGTLHARGRGRLDDEGAGLSVLELDELRIGRSDLDAVRARWAGEGVEIRIGGGVLDVEPLLAEPEEPAAEPREEKREFTPLAVSAPRLQRLYFGAERYLEGAALELVREPTGWRRIGLRGAVPRGLWSYAASAEPEEAPRTFALQYGPDAAGALGLAVATDDVGGVLRALDALDTVQGGRLEISGRAEQPLPGGPLRGRIEAHDYVVVDAPVLTRLLTVASLTGIVDLLRGEGIRFSRLVGDFTLQDGVLETDLMRAYGPALGLTAKGQIDFDASRVDLQGTVAPAYTLNRVLGEIPILGNLLVGGEGQGLLAFIYRARGSLDDPEVSVNPLSALAPGFLRNLFGLMGSGSDASPDDQPRALPERIDP